MFLRGVLPTNRLSLLKYLALAVNLILAGSMSFVWAGFMIGSYARSSSMFEMLEHFLFYAPLHFAIVMAASISIPMLLITKNFDTDRNCRIVSSSYHALFVTSIVVFVSI